MNVSHWQPIETAPKDGSRVLAYWRGAVLDDKPYSDEFGVVQWSESLEWHDASDGDEYGEPDFWMHLPEPPK